MSPLCFLYSEYTDRSQLHKLWLIVVLSDKFTNNVCAWSVHTNQLLELIQKCSQRAHQKLNTLSCWS